MLTPYAFLIRDQRWQDIAELIENEAKRSYESGKGQTKSRASRYTWEKRFWYTPPVLATVFQLYMEDGTCEILKHLPKKSFFNRVDISEWLVELSSKDPQALAFALKHGWGSQFGLLPSRMVGFQHHDIDKRIKPLLDLKDPLVDDWFRLWGVKNPNLYGLIHQPTLEEARAYYLAGNYSGGRRKLLELDPEAQTLHQTMLSLGKPMNSYQDWSEFDQLYKAVLTQAPKEVQADIEVFDNFSQE